MAGLGFYALAGGLAGAGKGMADQGRQAFEAMQEELRAKRAADEAQKGRDFTAGENKLTRDQQVALQDDRQTFDAEQGVADREFRSGESARDRSFRSGESAADRKFRSAEAASERSFKEAQFGLDRDLRRGLSAAEIASREGITEKELAARAGLSERELAARERMAKDDREFRGDESEKDRRARADEGKAGRALRQGENETDRSFRERQAEADRTFRREESEKDRTIRKQPDRLTAAERAKLQVDAYKAATEFGVFNEDVYNRIMNGIPELRGTSPAPPSPSSSDAPPNGDPLAGVSAQARQSLEAAAKAVLGEGTTRRDHAGVKEKLRNAGIDPNLLDEYLKRRAVK